MSRFKVLSCCRLSVTFRFFTAGLGSVCRICRGLGLADIRHDHLHCMIRNSGTRISFFL
jgi:hypothetical protein